VESLTSPPMTANDLHNDFVQKIWSCYMTPICFLLTSPKAIADEILQIWNDSYSTKDDEILYFFS
jgi:hypothetical protein